MKKRDEKDKEREEKDKEREEEDKRREERERAERGARAATQQATQLKAVRGWNDRAESVPKIPKSGGAAGTANFCSSMQRHIAGAGLGGCLTQRFESSPDVIRVVDHEQLYPRCTKAIVDNHAWVFKVMCNAVADSALQDEILTCHSVPEAWEVIQRWCLPLQDGDKDWGVAQFENVSIKGDEDPREYFARVARLAHTLERIGEEKSPQHIARVALRQLPDSYHGVEKRTISAVYTILRLEDVKRVVQKSYADHKFKEIRDGVQQDGGGAAATAAGLPSNPHALAALAVPRGFQGGGGRGRGRGDFGGYHGGRGLQPGDGAYLMQQSCRGRRWPSTAAATAAPAVWARGRVWPRVWSRFGSAVRHGAGALWWWTASILLLSAKVGCMTAVAMPDTNSLSRGPRPTAPSPVVGKAGGQITTPTSALLQGALRGIAAPVPSTGISR